MKRARRPPALFVRTTVVTFITAAALLAVTFVVVLASVRAQVRTTVVRNLASSQRMFAAAQGRERRAMRLQIANLAETPTLKAAVDTYAAESPRASREIATQLLNTIQGALTDMAGRSDADAVVVVDTAHRTLAAAGRTADLWRRGDAVVPADGGAAGAGEHIVHLETGTFRVVTTPLTLSDGSEIGRLCLATSLDRRFVRQSGEIAGARMAIVSGERILTSTLPPAVEQSFDAVAGSLSAADGTLTLDGESHAFRRLLRIGDTSFYALASIDEAARPAIRATTLALSLIAVGAICLALLASIWLSKRLSQPITGLSEAVQHVARSRQFDARLPRDGSSLELDQLTETFNALMSSVAVAEAETEAACTAAIRALAAALDARDPYTAGHSERVSVVSVAISRAMRLPEQEIEVVRLGALLHDIGKIGVPDDILRKPGPLTAHEYDTIKAHTVVGARILRTVPFLASHVPIVELHHERPDGQGYPHGLRGDEIPLAAQIVHVADAYDAITNARAYRRGRPTSEALRELWSCAGTDFNAEVVGALAVALPGLTSAVRTTEPVEFEQIEMEVDVA